MSEVLSNNKRIAKNTLLLYVRMLFLTVVSLYTSRVLLKALGVDDYGIYNVVGGIVVIFSFISSSLSSAVQRFISFALGKGDLGLLKKIFDISITVFLIIGILLFILIEIGGVYFLNFKMNIPENRMEAANWVLQFSILSFLISIISIPYNSVIIAHEKMDVYAYFSIIEFSLKLFVTFLLSVLLFDRLVLYSILIFVVTVFTRVIYQIYCRSHFTECKSIKLCVEKKMGKDILSYSGWNMIGSLATISKQQGINIIQNIFFGPIMNAAHAIAIQVSSALTQFTNNVFLATRPSITKIYAQGNTEGVWELVFYSTKYALYLFILVVIPVYIEIPMILYMWLGNVPDITIAITRLMLASISVEIVCAQIFAVFQAANMLKKVQIYSCSIILLILPVSYFILNVDHEEPLMPYIISLIASSIFTFTTLVIAKIELKLKLMNYLCTSIFPPLCIAALTFFIASYFCSVVEQSIARLFYTLFLVILLSISFIFTIGLTKKEKLYLQNYINKHIMIFLNKIKKRISIRERKEMYGEENPDKIFYVIRVDYDMAGMLAIVKSTLSHIIYACEHGYIPVVDLLNCNCQYIDKSNPENVWDVFFIQPFGYNLNDIKRSKSLIISKNIQVPQKKYGIRVNALHSDKILLDKYRDYYKKYIHLNSSTKKFVDNKYNEIIHTKKHILGVLARGTDYLDCHPKGHPVQPAPYDIINKAKEVMREYGYEYLFLATEDQRIYDLFKTHFGPRLLFSGQKLLSGMKDAIFISQLNSKEGLNQKQDVLNYLATLHILSKCDAFIGGCTAGTIGAYMMSDEYEYEYFWNLGYY